MESFLGSIFAFGGNFAPQGTFPCDGRLLSIAQYSALFSILGTTYGGDGVQTFALPDLRGRAAAGWGDGPGLTPVQLGQAYGSENVTLLRSNLPPVVPPLYAAADASSEIAAGHLLGTADGNMYAQGSPNTTLNPNSFHSGLSGSHTPVEIQGPRLGVFFYIVAEGIYPSRG
jgi:microcystin-dependent protein